MLFWRCEYLLGGIATPLLIILVFCIASLLYLSLQIWECGFAYRNPYALFILGRGQSIQNEFLNA